MPIVAQKLQTLHVPEGHRIDLTIDEEGSGRYFTRLHFSFRSVGTITITSTPIQKNPIDLDISSKESKPLARYNWGEE